MKRSFLGILMLGTILLAGCFDIDPFGVNQMKLVDDFYLQYVPDGASYFVIEKGSDPNENVFDGKVLKIGWNNDIVVAEVVRTFRGERDGIYVIDVNPGVSRGPISDREFKSLGVRLESPSEIFKR
jgi:hypothetical protein